MNINQSFKSEKVGKMRNLGKVQYVCCAQNVIYTASLTFMSVDQGRIRVVAQDMIRVEKREFV